MLTSERKALILEILRQEGRLVARHFSQKMDVSEDTIRRDLRELAREGLLQRVHGGALPASSAVADFAARERFETSAKYALGKAGAHMIQPGQIIFLDGGTTNVQLARHLPRNLQATIVTHSPSIAVELARHPGIEVEIIGGRLFKHSVVALGASSAETIARIRFDAFFMGATGLHRETGVTTGDGEEAAIKRLIARQSAETIILATREKLGAASAYRIVPLEEVDTVVIEADTPRELLAPFDPLALNLVRAPGEPGKE